MTAPQTDAPERIWLEIDQRARITGQPEAHIEPVDAVKDAFTAYVRADALDARDAVIADLVEALDYALRAFDHCGTFRRDPLDEVFLMVREGSSIACMADARAALAKAAALK